MGNGDGVDNGKETLPIDGAGVNEAPNETDGTNVIPLPLIWAWDGKGINSKANNKRIITLSVLGRTIARKSPKAHHRGQRA